MWLYIEKKPTLAKVLATDAEEVYNSPHRAEGYDDMMIISDGYWQWKVGEVLHNTEPTYDLDDNWIDEIPYCDGEKTVAVGKTARRKCSKCGAALKAASVRRLVAQ